MLSLMRSRRAHLARRGGFNLLEILVALAIFSIGILEVLAVFPAAVVSGARAVRGVQARILQRTALAELQYQLRVSWAEGRVQAYAAHVLTAEGSPGWVDGEWVGCAAAITNRLAGDGRLQCARILANSANTLTLSRDLTVRAGDGFRITPLGLPLAATPESARTFRVAQVHNTETYTLLVEGAAFADDQWNGGNRRYFVAFTDGAARNRLYRITDTRNGNELVCNAMPSNPNDFIADGVRSGDPFVIVGSDTTHISPPCPDLGQPGSRQTVPPPHLRAPDEEAVYSYAVVLSDCHDDADADLVRVDVFIFHRYDDALPPGRNKRPIAHFVEHLGRR